jgi:hypothetical protein
MLALVLFAVLKMRVLWVRSCRKACFSHGDGNVPQRRRRAESTGNLSFFRGGDRFLSAPYL